MSLIKKKVYVTQEMHDSMLASFKSAFIAIGIIATILVLLALYYHIRYRRANRSEDINKYKELRFNAVIFLVPCAITSLLCLGLYPEKVGSVSGYTDVQLTDLKGIAHFDGQTLKIDPLPRITLIRTIVSTQLLLKSSRFTLVRTAHQMRPL